MFFSTSDRHAYLRLLKTNLESTGARLLAWCLMENHVHLVLIPGYEDTLEVLLRRVHGRYAQMINAKLDRSGHLWQNRYFSCALSAKHLRRAIAYVERNPVRAGIVEKAEHYQWSSAATHLGLVADRLQLMDRVFLEEFGGTEAWRALIAEPEELLTLRLLRRCTYAGRPFGEDNFVDKIEQEQGRKWRRWGFEKTFSIAS